MLENLQTSLYHLEQYANQLVAHQLSHLTIVSVGTIFLAGLLTSLTPCMLSMLPITIGYIGGYEAQGRLQGAIQSTWFSLGLATTLAGLGIVVAVLGGIYGQVGFGLPIVVSIIAILMGLNLLEIIPLQFPNLDGMGFIPKDIPPGIRAYLLGVTFGLVASPCSTPVLATLLAWIATVHKPWLGGILLLAYTVGYSTPLILAGTFTASLRKLMELRRWSSWITPASGAILVGFGVFSLLVRFFPSGQF